MGIIIYYLVLIVIPMGRILVRWKSSGNNLEMLCHPICNWLYFNLISNEKVQPIGLVWFTEIKVQPIAHIWFTEINCESHIWFTEIKVQPIGLVNQMWDERISL